MIDNKKQLIEISNERKANLLIGLAKKLILIIEKYNANNASESELNQLNRLNSKGTLELYEYASAQSDVITLNACKDIDVEYVSLLKGGFEEESTHEKEMWVWVMIDGKLVELRIKFRYWSEVKDLINTEIEKYRTEECQKKENKKQVKSKTKSPSM